MYQCESQLQGANCVCTTFCILHPCHGMCNVCHTCGRAGNAGKLRPLCDPELPLRGASRGADEGGLPGFVRGAGRGAAGVLIRPLAAGLETSMRVADSIRSAVMGLPPLLPRVRPPRYVPSPGEPLGPYNWSEVRPCAWVWEPTVTEQQPCCTWTIPCFWSAKNPSLFAF